MRETQPTIRVMLVDDHEILRAGVRELLSKEPDLSVIAEAGDGGTAVESARLQAPDVVVMDLRIPGLSGIDAARQIIDEQPEIRIVALSASTDLPIIRQTLLAGASAFVTKSSAFEELVAAIRAVAGGGSYFSPGIAEVMSTDKMDTQSMPLTPREREVLQLLAGGRTTKAAAATLSLSAKTIETHRRNLMRKLDVDNLADLTKFAIRTGLTSAEE